MFAGKSLLYFCVCLIIWFAGFHPVSAVDYTWTGGGDGTTWTASNNWAPDTGHPSDAGDRAIINTGAHEITVPAGLTIGGLTLGGDYTGTVSLEGDLTLADTTHAGDITVNSGTLQTGKDVVSGINAEGTFTIGEDGTMIVRRSSTDGEGLGQTITAGTMMVEGLLDADYQGFDGGQGPGSAIVAHRGAAHGGRGGGDPVGANPPYGSFDDPVSLGSGSNEGPGGGAIVLDITGLLTVNGTISVNGTGGLYLGASGGSINIKAAELAGDGTIQAMGGVSTSRRGGGGGRISLSKVGIINFTGNILLYDDATALGNRGYTGTVAFPDGYDLVLGGAGNMQTLRLGIDDDNDYTFNSIVIQDGGTLLLDGNPSFNDALGGPAVINASSIDVQDGGRISADELGWGGGVGNQGNYGATYGGRGGYNNTLPTYGSFTNPVVFGSKDGGGVVMLVVTDTLNVDGVISSDSVDKSLYTGSGGSVNLVAGELTGAGTISAKAGSSSSRGGGGGGRISLVNVDVNNFTGLIDASAGTSSYKPRGYAGTIAFPEGYDLTLGGAGNMQTLMLGTDDDQAHYIFGDIAIKDGGRLEIDGNPMRNDFYGGSAMITASSVDVQAGGAISAQGLGFDQRCAAPENRALATTNSGAHGGAGGDNERTYGSITNPVNLGSGGYHLTGGGVVILRVSGTVNVDGAITADSNDVAGNYGGAGGSVNITANRLTGTGAITADALSGARGGGGGGRIALTATESTFDGTLSAVGGTGTAGYAGHGAAGTIFTDLNGERRLLVENDKDPADSKDNYTYLPAFEHAPAEPELDDVVLVVAEKGRAALTDDMQVGNLYLTGVPGEIVSLFLQGRTLTVDSLYHDDWGDESLVLYEDGEIAWKPPPSGTIIRLW